MLRETENKKANQKNTPILERNTLHVMDGETRIALTHNWQQDDTQREIENDTWFNTNRTRYQYGDHLGSASMELSNTGQIISYEEYFPFGGTSLMAGTSQKEVKLKDYRYNGKERDDVTGLYYYGARYYASWLGRFVSVDPLADIPVQIGLSPYSAFWNNPIKWNDQDGMCPNCPKNGTSVSTKFSLTLNFGTRNQSSFSFGVGVGLSANKDNFMTSLNVSGRVYGGGLGTTGTKNGQTGFGMDIVASPAITYGKGTDTPMALSTFNAGTYNLTGVNNPYQKSITLGSNFVANTEGYQRVGNISFRSNNYTMNIYNDFIPLLGDRDDRWWTGGGMINVNLGKGNVLTFGTEVFTGERIEDKTLEERGEEFNTVVTEDKIYKTKYLTTVKENRAYYQQSERGAALTNGATFFQINSTEGLVGKINFSGNGLINPMYSQNSIHDNFPLIPFLKNEPIPRFSSSQEESLQLGVGLNLQTEN